MIFKEYKSTCLAHFALDMLVFAGLSYVAAQNVGNTNVFYMAALFFYLILLNIANIRLSKGLDSSFDETSLKKSSLLEAHAYSCMSASISFMNYPGINRMMQYPINAALYTAIMYAVIYHMNRTFFINREMGEKRIERNKRR